jgi:hypothetical protein
LRGVEGVLTGKQEADEGHEVPDFSEADVLDGINGIRF